MKKVYKVIRNGWSSKKRVLVDEDSETCLNDVLYEIVQAIEDGRIELQDIKQLIDELNI